MNSHGSGMNASFWTLGSGWKVNNLHRTYRCEQRAKEFGSSSQLGVAGVVFADNRARHLGVLGRHEVAFFDGGESEIESRAEEPSDNNLSNRAVSKKFNDKEQRKKQSQCA